MANEIPNYDAWKLDTGRTREADMFSDWVSNNRDELLEEYLGHYGLGIEELEEQEFIDWCWERWDNMGEF